MLLRATAASCLLMILCLLAAGCGFAVAPADLFQLHRVGPGRALTLLISDGGTVRCNGRSPIPLSDSMLIAARDIADDLNKDAKAHLRFPPHPGSVYVFSLKLQEGNLNFADIDGASRQELARAELFAAQTAAGPCAGH